jgi:hypothetical protein
MKTIQEIFMRKLACLLAVAFFISFSVQAGDSDYIRATTYFGSAWPVNYWNSSLNQTDKDFLEIKDDGFNAVVLVVPWGEFQPGLEPVRYNEEAYRRLAKVCHSAKRQGLKVFLRVSYLWDMYPGRELPNTERINALISSDALLPAWQKYLSRIGFATKSCAEGSFISWEDFWPAMQQAENVISDIDGALLSRKIGFDKWARKNADKDFLKKYALTEKRLGAYPIPGRKSPDFRQVYKWFDDQLLDRLMLALAKNLANASIEARVDDDPIYNGEKLIDWYSHKKTYQVSTSPYVMTYWAPAMGAENRRESDSANKVLDRFTYMQKKISKDTENKIFIEQFLFKDNTPSMAQNAIIAPEEVSHFLKNIATPMLKQTSGYALWGARDYDASTLFNGSFSLGALNWKFSSGANVIKLKDNFYARLKKGASILQSVSSDRDLYRGFAKSTTLRFSAIGAGVMTATYAGYTNRITLSAAENSVKLTFPVAHGTNSDLILTSEGGTIDVTDIYLYNFTQISDVRNSLGQPARHLNDIRALNKALAEAQTAPSQFEPNHYSFSQIEGVYAPEQAGVNWFAWAGPQVKLKLIPRAVSIKIKGFIRPSMFNQPQGCNLDGYIDSVKVLSRNFTTDGPIDLVIPVGQNSIGKSMELQIRSTCVINPKRQKSGADDRNLSFVLTEINANKSLP